MRVFCAAGCGKQRGKPDEEPFFLRCDRCLGAFYCSRECQLNAWPEHKGPCKEAKGEMDSIGKTSIADIDKQIAEYKKDAEVGNAEAQFNLGVCYLTGAGVAIDMRETIKWYARAAEAGNMMAQYNLGCFYRDGKGVEVDLHKAFKWFKRAAEAGHASSQDSLGYCYANGAGVAVDKCEAFKWCKRAAKAGETIAQFNLGMKCRCQQK